MTKTKCIAYLFCLLACSLHFFISGAEGGDVLPESLKGLSIRDDFVESTSKQVGFVSRVSEKGRLVILHREEKAAYYAKEKDPVYERDALYTLGDCRCRIEFKDKNIIMMAPESHLGIDEVTSSFLKGEKTTLLSMWRGRAIFYALRLFGYSKMSFELRSPAAAIGVRGTKFGAEIERVRDQKSGRMDRMLAGIGTPLVQAETTGENLLTRAYVFEGEVDVTSLVDGKVQRLRENEIIEADMRGLGKAFVDLERTRRFVETVISGMEVSPGEMPPILDQGFRREDLERMDRLNDIKQQEIQRGIDRDYRHTPSHPSSP